MECDRCGGKLVTVLERTRGVCAACHVYPETNAKRQAIGRSAAPPSRSSQSGQSNAEPAGETDSGSVGEGTP